MKKLGKYSISLFCTLICILLVFDFKLELENELLLLILNTLFTGLIPVAVGVIALKAFLKNGLPCMLLMSSGMLIFGSGSIITGILMIGTDSANSALTIYNTCAFVGGTCHLFAAMRESSNARKLKHKQRRAVAWAFAAASAIFVLALLILVLRGMTPVFITGNESTQLRNIVLHLSIAFYFGASMVLMKQYKIFKHDFLYWYSLSLLLFATGLFAVSFIHTMGDLMNWVGRACQYIGAVYALLSIYSIIGSANKSGESAPHILTEFFMNAESGYKNLIEALPNAVVSVDENHTILMMNSAAKKILCGGQAISGKSFINHCVSKQSRGILKNDFLCFVKSGHSDFVGKITELRMQNNAGIEFPAEIAVSITKLKTGYLSTYIISDITNRVKMKTDLVKQADEIYKKNKLITEFFINISHEFKTPLSVLMLSAELLDCTARTLDNNTRQVLPYLATIRQSANRLTRLITNLIDLTKLDAGLLEPNWKNTDIVALIENLVNCMRPYISKKGLRIDSKFSENQKMMLTDVYLLDRIILNLVSNSIKHTSPGGWIHVNCTVLETKVYICVADDGVGVPDEKKNEIFDRFRQVNTSLIRYCEGCGIGLALSKGMIEKMGGSISYTAIPSGGSSFCIELPVLTMEEKSNHVDYIGMQLDKRIEMEFSDIDF